MRLIKYRVHFAQVCLRISYHFTLWTALVKAGILLLPILRWGPWSSRGFHTVSGWAGTLPAVWYLWVSSSPSPHLIFQPYAGHRIHCRTVVKSEFPQRSQPHLSWCSTAISYLLWESSLASPTTLNQALNIFFRRKRTRSFRTSSSTWVRYWGWGREETWDKQYHRQRIRANKQYKRELQQI